jgi:general nucleoside transport system ATP-binding protein
VRTEEVEPADLAQMMVGRPTLGVRRADRTAAALATDTDLAAARTIGDTDLAAAGTSAELEPGTARTESPDSAASHGPVLSIEELRLAGSGRDVLDGVTLAVSPGEIVGVAGVSGNGQTELVEVLCGLRAPTGGRVMVNSVDITGSSPAEVIAAGLGRLTEDRHASVVSQLSVEDNLVLEDLPAFRRSGLLDRTAIRQHADLLIDRFSIKARPDDPLGSLSGGNMQKLLLARTLARDPVALVAAQPTRGLDVGAAEFVHTQLLARRSAGGGVLLISEDLEELLALSDRIVVMFEGRVVGELSAAEAEPQTLGLLMAGHSLR